MTIKKEDILEVISSMSVMEIVELIAAMEEKFNVSAQPPAGMLAAAPAASDDAVAQQEEKTAFDVVLKEIGASKVGVIKEVKAILGLGLKESKDKVDSAPTTIKEGVTKEEAESIVKKLQEAGATAEIK